MPDDANSHERFRTNLILIPVIVAVAILGGIWIYQDFDLSGDGARKLAENLRAIDRDYDAISRAQDPHCCGWKARWEDTGVSTNAIDGTVTRFLSSESVDPDGADGSAAGGPLAWPSTYMAWLNRRDMSLTKTPARQYGSDLTKKNQFGKSGASQKITMHYIPPVTKSNSLANLRNTISCFWNLATTKRHREP